MRISVLILLPVNRLRLNGDVWILKSDVNHEVESDVGRKSD